MSTGKKSIEHETKDFVEKIQTEKRLKEELLQLEIIVKKARKEGLLPERKMSTKDYIIGIIAFFSYFYWIPAVVNTEDAESRTYLLIFVVIFTFWFSYHVNQK